MYFLDIEAFLSDHALIMKRAYLSLAGIVITTIALTWVNLDGDSHDLKNSPPTMKDPPICTFSIVAFDPEQQEWGVAVASKFLAVGAVVPWAKAGAGAIATQSHANTSYGPKALELLSQGKSADEVIKLLTEEDPGKDVRQVGIVDSKGNTATYTGSKCMPWA